MEILVIFLVLLLVCLFLGSIPQELPRQCEDCRGSIYYIGRSNCFWTEYGCNGCGLKGRVWNGILSFLI